MEVQGGLVEHSTAQVGMGNWLFVPKDDSSCRGCELGREPGSSMH